MRRRSILLDEGLDRRIERRARERGTTFTDAVREALAKEFYEGDENPNQWLLDLADEIQAIVDEHGMPDVPRFPIDSDEAKLQMARDTWRRKMNREPDF